MEGLGWPLDPLDPLHSLDLLCLPDPPDWVSHLQGYSGIVAGHSVEDGIAMAPTQTHHAQEGVPEGKRGNSRVRGGLDLRLRLWMRTQTLRESSVELPPIKIRVRVTRRVIILAKTKASSFGAEAPAIYTIYGSR